MKKIFIGIVLSIMLCLFLWSPSLVKADTYQIGYVWFRFLNQDYNIPVYSTVAGPYHHVGSNSGELCLYRQNNTIISRITIINPATNNSQILYADYTYALFIDDLVVSSTIRYSNRDIPVYGNYDEYEEDLPNQLQRNKIEKIWDDFLHFMRQQLGLEPGPIYELLYDLALGDDSLDTDITFPTLTPTPTPTPIPTSIPVQTIFVPDGNGNTTIIYQYPDPTTGVITQSPYNPNDTNNVVVNYYPSGGSGNDNNTFTSSPQDPYSFDTDLFWADGFGVEMSDSPLSTANDSQKNLKGAADEYSSSVQVMSNSFNVLPIKWLSLVGLLGGIIIIAGLIRTFLGG